MDKAVGVDPDEPLPVEKGVSKMDIVGEAWEKERIIGVEDVEFDASERVYLGRRSW